MPGHDDEIEQLAQSRAEADRLYNEALTALDETTLPRPELPRPAADFDDRQLQPLNESWRLISDEPIDLGTGWRRRLRGLVWRLVAPFLQRQQRFNALLVEHLNRNVAGERESRASSATTIAAVDRQGKALADLRARLMYYLQQVTLYVDTRDRYEVGKLRREVGKLRREVGQLHREVNATAHDAAEVRRLTVGLAAVIDRVTDDVSKRLELASARNQLLTELTVIRDGLHGLQDEIDRRATIVHGLSESVELLTAATHSIKREIERLCTRPPAPAPTVDPNGAFAPDLDAYKYIAFEDKYRGSREAIATAQRLYLPYFDGASDVLDLGCGRGEFLELLREAGISARGLDLNAEAVDRCRERGFDATRADALDYLRGLADESLGGLFSAQVVEHLEADYIMRMLAETQRVLRPGAHVVLETINPTSWTAFFSAFIRDVTHRHPLHPETLSFFLRASGFVDVTTVYRSPVPDAGKLQRATVGTVSPETPAGTALHALTETFNEHVDRLNGLIFAEQDYAAIARRP